MVGNVHDSKLRTSRGAEVGTEVTAVRDHRMLVRMCGGPALRHDADVMSTLGANRLTGAMRPPPLLRGRGPGPGWRRRVG